MQQTKRRRQGVNFCCFSKPAFNQLPLKHLNIYVMSVDCLVKVSVQPDSVVNSLEKKAEKQISTFLLWWCSKPSQDKAEAANPICVNFISCTCVLWLNKSASKLTKCEVIIDLKTDPN